MAFSDYSLTPAGNITISGISIAENCPPGNLNDAMRQFAADGRALSDQVAGINLSSYAPLAGPAFTAQPLYVGRGALLHHNNSANASGRLFVQAIGTALPTLANGDMVAEY